MVENVGTVDRAGRAVLSLALLSFAWKKEGKAGVAASFLAGELMASVLSGYCPLYRILNFSTVGKPL
jgi:hypothetical protein